MGRRRGESVSVHVGYIDVDIDEIMDDMTIDELQAEINHKIAAGETPKKGGRVPPTQEDWDRLAEFIASGDTQAALDELARLIPAIGMPAHVLARVRNRLPHH